MSEIAPENLNKTERGGERVGADEKREILATDSQLTEADEHRRANMSKIAPENLIETERGGERGGADERKEILATDSQLTEADEHRRMKNRYEEIHIENIAMNPPTRIVAKLNGEYRRKPTATRMAH